MNYTNYTNSNSNSIPMIIESDRYNGRVNILEPSTLPFQMAEKIALKNKSTSYCDALVGNLETNVLAQVFFSAQNIQIIQNGLRAGVYKMSNSKFVIPPQNIDSLKIVMRSTYLQYAQHRQDISITQQVEQLNQLVLDYCIPSVYGDAMGYMKYTQDQSTLVVPLELPLNHDREYKQLELKPYI